MPIAFVTGNASKFQEITAVIPGIVQLNLDLDEIQGLDPKIIIEHKLSQAATQHDGDIIVEDTSLEFNCLGRLPGPLIKWFEQSLSNTELADLVSRFPDHTAIASCTIGYRPQGGSPVFFTGSVTGTIVPPRGIVSPFGWNNIFQPLGSALTYAEMTIAAKNTTSMRGQAATQLQQFLSQSHRI